MQLGVIGSGRIGRMHAINIASHPEVDSVLIGGRSQQRLAAAVDHVRHYAPVPGGEARRGDPPAQVNECADISHLLQQVDGVVIATSTASHPDLVRRAVAAGVPVLVEKPLAFDSGELEELSAELEAQPVPVMVGFQRRYDPAYQRLRSHVRGGDLGQVRVTRSSGHDRHRLDLAYIPDSGGIWRDLMIHDFDVIPWVLDEAVTHVYATGSVLDEPAYSDHDDVDTAVAVLTLTSGAIATVSGVRHTGAGHDVRLEVFGSEDTYGVGFDDSLPVTSTDDGGRAPVHVHDDFDARFEVAFRAEIDHFIQLIDGNATSLTPPSAGLPASRLAEAAEQSWRSGNGVALPPP